MTLKTDPNLGVDFDYFVERNVISEEEVSWKRYTFHGPYIYRSSFDVITDYYLFMREIEFMAEHPELKMKEGRKNFLGMKLTEPKSLEKLTATQIIKDHSDKSGQFDEA